MDKTALVVDDDPCIVRLLTKYLIGSGYHVISASSGEEAMALALSEAPPIVVTDFNMPGMDGLELCRSLRSHEGIRFVYVIIITASSEISRLVEAFDAGADDFIPKPIKREELLSRLRAGERISQLNSDVEKRTLEIHRLNAEMAIANNQLQRMATTDELTGLLNRRKAMSKLEELGAMRERYGNQLSCIMLDIDHFKKINDVHGHACGDAVLKQIGVVLQGNVRSTDIVCRVGGEEFLVLCPNVGIDGAVVCAEHIRMAVEQHDFAYGTIHLNVTVSLGVAEQESGASQTDTFVKLADQALYESKHAGRNRVTSSGKGIAEPLCPTTLGRETESTP